MTTHQPKGVGYKVEVGPEVAPGMGILRGPRAPQSVLEVRRVPEDVPTWANRLPWVWAREALKIKTIRTTKVPSLPVIN